MYRVIKRYVNVDGSAEREIYRTAKYVEPKEAIDELHGLAIAFGCTDLQFSIGEISFENGEWNELYLAELTFSEPLRGVK